MWTLLEACAGTAAFSFFCLGLKAPVPMAGSKRMLAPQLRRFFPPEPPSKIHLNDPGEWGATLKVLLGTPGGCKSVAECLLSWQGEDQRELFDHLRSTPPIEDPVERAATHIYLADAEGFRRCNALNCENGRTEPIYGAANSRMRVPNFPADLLRKTGNRGMSGPSKDDVLRTMRWCDAMTDTLRNRAPGDPYP